MSSAPRPLASRLLASTGAATFSQVWRFVVTLATHMVLRRLLGAENWGLYHWAVDTLFQLLPQIRDLGLPAQMVRANARPWRLYLILQLSAGVGLGALVLVFAPNLAAFYPEGGAALVDIVRFLVVFLILDGIAKVPVTFFEAQLDLGRTVIPEVARNLTYAAVAIPLALLGFEVWSLLIAHVAATAVYAALLWARAWGKIPRGEGELLPLLGQSLPLMGMAFALLAIEWVDFAILGLVADPETVGHYGGALRLAVLCALVIELPIRRALYPAFVAVRDHPQRVFEVYRLSTLVLLVIQAPFAAILLVEPETLLAWAWGAEYVAAAPYLRCLALVPLVQPFHRCVEDVLLARHEERYLIAAALTTLGTIVVLGVVLAEQIGPIGVAVAKLLPVGALLTAWAVRRVDPVAFRRLAGELVQLYLMTAVVFAPVLLVPSGWVRLVVAGGAALVVLAWGWWRWGAELRDFFRVPAVVG